MRFGKQILEEIVSEKGGVGAVAGSLLVPPDTELVSGAADDVRLAIAVEIIGEHVGARLAEVGGVKFPGFLAR